MRKINYPEDEKLEDFKLEYYNTLNKNNEDEINYHLRNINLRGSSLTFEILVKLPFEDLIDLKSTFKQYSKNIKSITREDSSGNTILINPFEELFTYKANQSNIAKFFMEQQAVELNTCFYCGIDYINAFVDIDAYEGPIHFLNNAPKKDLEKIKGIGDAKSTRIIETRELNSITDLHDIDLSDEILTRIHNMEFVNSHNHFTLDHVLPQSGYKYFSLCLFNFVPSCYSCNSKFKKDTDFIQNASIKAICPTSSHYNLTNDLTFDLYFDGHLSGIDSVQDFEINPVVKDNAEQINHYLSLFKINGRYNYHKAQLVPLIKKRIKYSESKIKEIAGKLGMSQLELKKLLFGEDIIKDEKGNIENPLFKLRKDVWTFINKNNE